MSRLRLLGAVLAAPLLIPATAGAYTTIGASPDIALPTTPLVGCAPAAACTIVQDRLSNIDQRVSERGVVVRWRVHGEGGQARLRRVGGGTTATAPLPTTGGTAEYPARLPVQAGDMLAVDLLDGAQLSREPNVIGLESDLASTWTPPLADGETRAPSETVEAYWLYQADVEPDRDGDGLGDETQDPDGGVVTPPPGPPTPPAPPAPPTPPGQGEERTQAPRVEPPRTGPTLKLAGSAAATKKGVVTIALANPYDVALKGSLTLKQGSRKAGSAKVSLAARGSRSLTVRLSKPALRTLTKKRSLKLSAALTLRGPSGKARTTRATVTAKLGPAPRRSAPSRPGSGDGGRTDGGRSGAGFDGTYRAPDGQVMVVQDGRVLSFSGMITTYCTRTAKQRNIDYGMFGDDPDPVIAADGSFAYEATRGYGFTKLKYDGRIAGDVVTGRLVVEDRSMFLSNDNRFEVDYCFAGKDYRLSR